MLRTTDLEAESEERRTGAKPKKEFMQYLQSMLELSTDHESTSRLEATDSEPEEDDDDESEEPEAPCRRRRRRVRRSFSLASRPNHINVMEVRLEAIEINTCVIVFVTVVVARERRTVSQFASKSALLGVPETKIHRWKKEHRAELRRER